MAIAKVYETEPVPEKKSVEIEEKIDEEEVFPESESEDSEESSSDSESESDSSSDEELDDTVEPLSKGTKYFLAALLLSVTIAVIVQYSDNKSVQALNSAIIKFIKVVPGLEKALHLITNKANGLYQALEDKVSHFLSVSACAAYRLYESIYGSYLHF